MTTTLPVHDAQTSIQDALRSDTALMGLTDGRVYLGHRNELPEDTQTRYPLVCVTFGAATFESGYAFSGMLQVFVYLAANQPEESAAEILARIETLLLDKSHSHRGSKITIHAAGRAVYPLQTEDGQRGMVLACPFDAWEPES